MSLYFGAYSLDPREPIPVEWKTWVRSQISRKGLGTVEEFNAPGFFASKLDVNGFSSPAWTATESGDLAFACGEPVLADRSRDTDRATELEKLSRASSNTLAAILRTSRGTFMFAHFRARDRSLIVATDRLGARPLYWSRIGEIIVFAGARRLIWGLPGTRPAVDIQGLVEFAGVGVPLGDRTEIAGMRMVQGGRILRVRNDEFDEHTYWDWCRDAPAPLAAETPELRRALFQCLSDAVIARLGTSHAVYAALSGGLDSRTVVAVLAGLGIEVHTLNVSWDGSLDQILARQVSQKLGTRHHDTILPDDEDGRDILPRCWSLMQEYAGRVRELHGVPGQYWGGNDGSISVGYVYVSPGSVAALRAGKERDAAQSFCTDMGMTLSTRVLGAPFATFPPHFPVDAVARELESIDCRDPGQRLYYFLLLNHQRRMLGMHIDDVDLYPCEQVEPYFDTEFLSFACCLPVDASIGHGLYHRWLTEFQPAVFTTPWQTYPNHEPCPLPLPAEAGSQWEVVRKRIAAPAHVRMLGKVGALLGDWPVAGPLIRKQRLRALYLAQRLGLLDASTTLQQTLKIAEIVRVTSGRLAG